MKRLARKSFAALVYACLYLPILVLVIYSFNNARYSMQWSGVTTRWYRALFHDSSLWDAFLHSTLLGVCSAFVTTLLGTLVCVHFFLHREVRRRVLFSLLLLLVIIPDLVLGIALLIFFNVTGFPFGFWTLLTAHVTFCLPFVVLTVNSRIQTLDPNLYWSALDLGASRKSAYVRVLLPLLWPAVFSAFLLCFTLSFDDVIISYFVAGPDYNILPLTIYSMVRTGVSPELNALCTITFLLSMLLVILAHRLSRNTP